MLKIRHSFILLSNSLKFPQVQLLGAKTAHYITFQNIYKTHKIKLFDKCMHGYYLGRVQTVEW